MNFSRCKYFILKLWISGLEVLHLDTFVNLLFLWYSCVNTCGFTTDNNIFILAIYSFHACWQVCLWFSYNPADNTYPDDPEKNHLGFQDRNSMTCEKPEKNYPDNINRKSDTNSPENSSTCSCFSFAEFDELSSVIY